MNIKKLYLVSSIIMIILILAMCFNFFILPLSDWIIRVIGLMLMFDLFLLTFSSVKIMQNNTNNRK